MNLPYSAESTESDTAGDSVSVVLKEQLNSSTVYYYTVSAVSGDVTVRVQGTFTTPQYSMHNVHTGCVLNNGYISSCCSSLKTARKQLVGFAGRVFLCMQHESWTNTISCNTVLPSAEQQSSFTIRLP